MAYLKLAKILGPIVVIVGLLMTVLFLRNDVTKASAERNAAKAEAANLSASNAENARTMAAMGQARVDNDAIANAVAAKIHINVTRETRVVTALKDAKRNDPNVRTWADSPIPGSVRAQLAPAGDNVQAPAP